MDTKELKQMLDEEKKQRVEACAKELLELLQKYNCILNAIPKITQDGRISADVVIVASEG